MSWYRRASAPGLGKTSNRRRSSASYSVAVGRRTSNGSSRIRSSSKGHIRDFGDDDIEVFLPPLEEMPTVVGYEDVTFEMCTVNPPPAVLVTEDDDASDEMGDLKPFTELPHLSEKEIRKTLIRHADSRCAFDKDAAREMRIVRIDYRPGYKYTLESFTETRQVAWSFEPYTGGPLDEVGPAPPGPWEVGGGVGRPKPFHVHCTCLEVPHTDLLTTCKACYGVGSRRCTACSALGWERCSLCLGDGHKISMQGHRERCFRCIGTGRKKCWKCGGETIAVCAGCSGTGQIRCFIALNINWSNHVDTDILDPSDALPISEKLEYVKGHLVFQDERPMLASASFPVKDLECIANSLLEKHQRISSGEKLLLQRHGVWAIPVTCVTYEWKHKQKSFFVYGSKNEVCAPDFPERYCCCCAVS
ncbi:hypothetical protein JTE90_017235 [Oedothorax gibbosus]|uniref:Protein SSUH2 homolog n=1 Tax=Oedothorax gibbosus TaxID=931172 RepID=A0AAV6VDL6_9ARAC|nr:hypothetical protein JTE90_017235 [Oedothorax gibbosus]